MTESLEQLTAAETVSAIDTGRAKATEIAKACLSVVEAREPEVQAWQFLDSDYVLKQAAAVDETHEYGRGIGPLGGVLVGIKDIIDTRDMPTENGTPVDEGRRPTRDAACVAALREAGAIIMGKTVTTELASYTPGKTRNPHNPGHTPGGSSSGSAAAVAANMCHVALGSQTNGSMIRPASFCGVYGFKPTFGLISRWGILEQSPPFDTLGVFARTIEDIAMVTEALAGMDERDPDMWVRARSPIRSVAVAKAPMEPIFAFVKTPFWNDHIEPETAEAFEELTAALGEKCEEVELAKAFAEIRDWHQDIMFADMARNYGERLDRAPDKISPRMTSMIEEGRKVTAVRYNHARGYQRVCRETLAPIFERYNAIITPASPGPAPAGLESTGNPIFSTIWTFCGLPAISVPLLEIKGLPVGVQIVGQFGEDARLLRTANWLVRHLSAMN